MDFRRTIFDNTTAQQIANLMKRNTVRSLVYLPSLMPLTHLIQTITVFILFKNNIGHAGTLHLADMLQDNTVTRILNSSTSHVPFLA